MCKKASLKIYQTSLCFFMSLRLSLCQEKAQNPITKVPSKFPRLFSFCKLFSLKLLLVQCPWQFLTMPQWRSWWTPQASYSEGKKTYKTKQKHKHKPGKKKKKKKTILNGTMRFESNSRFLRKTIKQSEDERLRPVLSGIAKSYPASLILCICSELAVCTRESLVCFFITFFFFSPFPSQSDFGKQNPTPKKKTTRKTSNQVWNFLGMDGRVWEPIMHFASDSASTK